ncbi:MAG: thermonuclease family protein [Neisseriaceae bacterium]|nr:thermonuclease family protein [Neisseriaceae bacterium]
MLNRPIFNRKHYGLSALMLAVLCFQAACANNHNACTVIKISDGDSFTCRMNNDKKQTIRMSGIDAPEMNQTYGKNARAALQTALLGKKVRLQNISHDRYGRTLATVYLNNKDQNLNMVATGNAWVYRRYNQKPNYIQAEQTAQQQKIGLWQNNNPVYPEDWRRKNGR